MTELPKYQFKEHLGELRSRLMLIGVFFISAFLVSYYFSEEIFHILLKPLTDISGDTERRMIYTGLTEAFFTYMNLSVFAALCLSLPLISVQTYFFLRPGLYKSERYLAGSLFIFAPILFILGGLFVYYFVMPKAWEFFLSFEVRDAIIPLMLEARISEYLGLISKLIMAFGLAFQMPIILILLTMFGLMSSDILRKRRRIAIVIIFIIAGIITPPDILSQIALALPMLLLYEISIAFCIYVEKGRKNA
jgi:sec-independent protein translocase protein TatC